MKCGIVVGHKGFVGKNLKIRLEELGYRIYGIGKEDSLSNLSEILPEIKFIVNCAGRLIDSADIIDSNLGIISRLFNWGRGYIEKFIQIGSSSEYGLIDLPRQETMLCTPIDLYSGTKLAATNLILGYSAQYNIDAVVARPFSLYGPNDTPRKLIPRLINSILNDISMEVTQGCHDWTYIDDFIDGIVLLLESPSNMTKGQIVNFGTGIFSTNSQVIDTLSQVLNKTVHFKYIDQYKPNSPKIWLADNTKAIMKYGWTPKYTLETGLADLIKKQFP